MDNDGRIKLLKQKYGGDFCWCQYLAIENGTLTPLHVYVQYDEFELVKEAVMSDADVNAIDEDGETPVFCANKIEILEFLLEHGADVNIKDHDKDTALHRWSSYHYEVSKALIDNGADINVVNNDGYTPYDIACIYRNHRLMDLFKRHEAENGPVINGFPPLHKSVICNDLESTKELLENGADPDDRGENGKTALFWASSLEVARILFEYGAEVDALNNDNETPLYALISDFGYDNDEETVDIVSLLVSKGADVNFKDNEDWVPLHYCESAEIAEILIGNGADVEAVNNDGYTPFHSAVESGDMRFVELLLKHPVNINAKTKKNETALHLLSCGGGIEIAKMLVSAGIDINAESQQGNTVLHEMSRLCNSEIIGFLVSKGAKTDIKNIDGKTPLDIAIENDCDDVIKKLLKNN